MGPSDALQAVSMIQPRMVIPMHYNTFPPITQDADAFAEQVRKAGFEAQILAPGEAYTI